MFFNVKHAPNAIRPINQQKNYYHFANFLKTMWIDYDIRPINFSSFISPKIAT